MEVQGDYISLPVKNFKWDKRLQMDKYNNFYNQPKLLCLQTSKYNQTES